MTPLYPLRFQPILRRYLWGGRRLGTVLGKPIGPGEDYAESWEVVDHGPDQSVVSEGPLAGTTLHELVETRGRDLLGRHHPQTQFPLLFKFLDAHKNLSLQVHPDDQRAALLDPPDLGKTEAWYVMDAQPASKIFAGLKPEITRANFAREVAAGKVEPCVHHFHPKPGDCVLLPAGVVHAIGEGLLIAEIQQASDTTYRLHDWNRVGPDGQPRTLHVNAALEAIDFDYGPANPQDPQPTAHDHITRLAASEKFVLDRWDLNSPQPAPEDARCHILSVVEGQLIVDGDATSGSEGQTFLDSARLGPTCLDRGQTVLLPASIRKVLLRPQGRAVVLDMYLP